MDRLQSMKQTFKYSSGIAVTALCASTSEYALGLLAAYYSLRQVRKLGLLMS
ncbi:MAG: hypothetical protein ACI9OH_001307 [Oleispira sp.]|jgi:hypothetical protein